MNYLQTIFINRWKTILASILILGLVFIFRLCLFPLGVDQYGYDYGFYNYTIQHTPLNSWQYFIGQLHDYGNHLFVFINWLRVPQLPFLHISFYVLQGLSAVVIYLYLKKYSHIAALFGVVLFLLSISQNLLHSMFLWKAAYGQLLFLLLLIVVESKYWKSSLAAIVLLFITHKTSLLISLSSLIFYSAITYLNKRRAGIVLLTTIVLIIIYLTLFNGFSEIRELNSTHVRDGIFMPRLEYFINTWFLLPLAAIGLYELWKNNRFTVWNAAILTGAIWFIFSLPFYQRIILYFDLTIIIFASLGLVELIKIFRTKMEVVILTSGVLIISVLQLYWWLPTHPPQITDTEIAEIKNFSLEHQGGFLLAENSKDAPWLLANLHGNIRLSAPGLFEDIHTKQEWGWHFINIDEFVFYKDYPKPLFVYSKTDLNSQCFENISANFYSFKCN